MTTSDEAIWKLDLAHLVNETFRAFSTCEKSFPWAWIVHKLYDKMGGGTGKMALAGSGLTCYLGRAKTGEKLITKYFKATRRKCILDFCKGKKIFE